MALGQVSGSFSGGRVRGPQLMSYVYSPLVIFIFVFSIDDPYSSAEPHVSGMKR